MQLQDIKGHEYEAEIHRDLGFPEVPEARVSMIVLELPEDSLRLQRPSFQFLLIGWKVEPGLRFPFLPYIA